MIVNLTPHDLSVVLADESVCKIPKSGQVARVATKREAARPIGGVQTFRTTYGEVEGLPDPVDGTVFVVSGMVAARCPDRSDVFAPGELVRDGDGNVVGCRGLSQ
jgi:hypothetical protein